MGQRAATDGHRQGRHVNLVAGDCCDGFQQELGVVRTRPCGEIATLPAELCNIDGCADGDKHAAPHSARRQRRQPVDPDRHAAGEIDPQVSALKCDYRDADHDTEHREPEGAHGLPIGAGNDRDGCGKGRRDRKREDRHGNRLTHADQNTTTRETLDTRIGARLGATTRRVGCGVTRRTTRVATRTEACIALRSLITRGAAPTS